MASTTALACMVLLLGISSAAGLYVITPKTYDQIEPKLYDDHRYFIFKLDASKKYIEVVKEGAGYEEFKSQLLATDDLRYGYYVETNSCFRKMLVYWDREDKAIWNRMKYLSKLNSLGKDLNADLKNMVVTTAQQLDDTHSALKRLC